jgi:hypothetical protein
MFSANFKEVIKSGKFNRREPLRKTAENSKVLKNKAITLRNFPPSLRIFAVKRLSI